jgi:hypothetical protein
MVKRGIAAIGLTRKNALASDFDLFPLHRRSDHLPMRIIDCIPENGEVDIASGTERTTADAWILDGGYIGGRTEICKKVSRTIGVPHIGELVARRRQILAIKHEVVEVRKASL